MIRTIAAGSLLYLGTCFALCSPAHGQVLNGNTPNGSYVPLHAWYDVNQSTGIWEGRTDQYDDEHLVDVRDTATGSGDHRGGSYGTNVETWAQFDDTGAPDSSWPERVGGLTGTQNGMTTWEVRNGAGWDDREGWTDNDDVGINGIGYDQGYTIFLMMNVHSTKRYSGGWDLDPGEAQEDVPILNGDSGAFNMDPTTGSEPGKGLIWIDENREGYDGPQWVVDAGTELVTGPATLNEWQVHSFIIGAGDSGDVTTHYVNGQLLGQGDASFFEMSSIDFWSTAGGWHRAADLDFAEGLFYDAEMSDSDRVGIEQYLLDKWLSAAPTADTDDDGDVDGNDFLNIQRGDPSLISLWKSDFGSTTAGIATVPEPTSALLLVVMLGASLLGYRPRK